MKLTISRNSWHYKWYMFLNKKLNKWDWEEPSSVCNYFWGFIFTNLFVLFLIGVFAIIFVLATSPIYMILMKLGIIPYVEALVATSVVSIVLYIILIIRFGGEYVIDEIDYKYRNAKRKEGSFVNVTKANITAFKDKVCPMVDYKE